MKTLFNTSSTNSVPNGKSFMLFNKDRENLLENRGRDSYTAEFQNDNFLKPDTLFKMAAGQIPDLRELCQSFIDTFKYPLVQNSALQFLPAMQRIEELPKEQVKKFLRNPDTRHVLISNHKFELVLIHWRPGKTSNLHGHEDGGCLFKVLQGKLEEVRFSPDKKSTFLGSASYRTGSLGYIDNHMAFHQVGNPYGSSAISLHAYLK